MAEVSEGEPKGRAEGSEGNHRGNTEQARTQKQKPTLKVPYTITVEQQSPPLPLYTVLLFYKYVRLPAPELIVEQQKRICEQGHLKGRIRIADEGINGSIAGSEQAIQAYIQSNENDTNGLLADIQYKYSTSTSPPFPSLYFSRTQEMTASGVMKDVDLDKTGTLLEPHEWEQKVQQFNPDSMVMIDCRNYYETSIGKFEHAVDPKTKAFHQFPEFVQHNLNKLKDKQVLMYCTGGIRCEKATAYLKQVGINDVYHLNGGIHRYLEAFPSGGSFHGKNFVFDQRRVMESENKQIIGKCGYCGEQEDRVSKELVCRICFHFLLVCPTCEQTMRQANKSLYCIEHVLTNESETGQQILARLSIEQLIRLCAELLICIERATPKQRGCGRMHRHRRHLLQSQLDIVNNFIGNTYGEEKKNQMQQQVEKTKGDIQLVSYVPLLNVLQS